MIGRFDRSDERTSLLIRSFELCRAFRLWQGRQHVVFEKAEAQKRRLFLREEFSNTGCALARNTRQKDVNDQPTSKLDLVETCRLAAVDVRV